MKFSTNSLIRLISPNIKVMALPVAVLAVVAILFVYMISIGYSRITKQVEEYKTNQSIEAVLSAKLALLKKVQSEISDKTDVTILALPEKNPATWSISQLRLRGKENELLMDSINVSDPNVVDENLNSMDVDLHLTSQELPKLIKFLMSLPAVAPIFTIGDIEMERGQDGGWTANIEVSIYWSGLPKTLPAIDQPIEDLSSEEAQVLDQISTLTRPTFTLLEPSQPKERLVPFN